VFSFRLALALGRLDVDEMLSEMSAKEFREWRAYTIVEPWGFPFLNDHYALITCAASRGQIKYKDAAYNPVLHGGVRSFLTKAELKARMGAPVAKKTAPPGTKGRKK
jgi:hypothetical protein